MSDCFLGFIAGVVSVYLIGLSIVARGAYREPVEEISKTKNFFASLVVGCFWPIWFIQDNT